MSRYVARRRARFKGLSGRVNIPWGAVLDEQGGFLFYQGRRLCTATSQHAYDYFSLDDDGRGRQRGALVSAIKATLEKRDAGYQDRWNKLWGAPAFWRYRRQDHDDFWVWGHDFYNAPVEDLQAIARLIGAKVKEAA